jgi:hypothetical protein
MAGYWAMGSSGSESKPAMQIRIATTQAKTGRRMKKPGIAQRVSYGGDRARRIDPMFGPPEVTKARGGRGRWV